MVRLKELREGLQLSQEQLAKKIRTSQRNIGRWENGENEPSVTFVITLADFFGCTTDYLLGREDDFGVVAGNASNAPALTQEETQLLKDFRLLDDISKYKVIGYCHALI